MKCILYYSVYQKVNPLFPCHGYRTHEKINLDTLIREESQKASALS